MDPALCALHCTRPGARLSPASQVPDWLWTWRKACGVGGGGDGTAVFAIVWPRDTCSRRVETSQGECPLALWEVPPVAALGPWAVSTVLAEKGVQKKKGQQQQAGPWAACGGQWASLWRGLAFLMGGAGGKGGERSPLSRVALST